MDIVALLGLTSSITGIISFILYFVDKQKAKTAQVNSAPQKVQAKWKMWTVFALISVLLAMSRLTITNVTGIKGDNNKDNQIHIETSP
jgi:hypothetical protein